MPGHRDDDSEADDHVLRRRHPCVNVRRDDGARRGRDAPGYGWASAGQAFGSSLWALLFSAANMEVAAGVTTFIQLRRC